MADSLEGMSTEQVNALARLTQELAGNPATRLQFLKLSKQLDPKTPIPEYDMHEAIAKEFAMRDKRDAERAIKDQKRDVEDRVKAKRDELKEKGFKKDEIDEIEKLMLDKQIPSHETAAEYYRMQKQAAVPTPASLRPFQNNVTDTLKAFGKSPIATSRDEAHKAVDELIKNRAKAA